MRDQKSSTLLQDWNIEAVCAPDPVWAMSSQPLSQEYSVGIEPKIAVILRPHPFLTEARLAVLTEAIIQFQALTQGHILLVPFQPVSDKAIAQAIHAQLPKHSQIIELKNPRQLHALFETVNFAIAMRLHGVIMAAAARCRCWAISYDPKVSQLMQSLSIPGWELEQLPDNAAAIAQSWVHHYHHGLSLSFEEIKEIGDRARLHRNLLLQQLAP